MKAAIVFLMCCQMASAIYQDPNTFRVNLRSNNEDIHRHLSIGDWVSNLIRPHKQHEKKRSAIRHSNKLRRHRNVLEINKDDFGGVETFPEPVRNHGILSKEEIIDPRLIAEDLHDINKENEQHSEMIDPRLIAEDLHDIKKENEQHSEMIEPRLIAENLHDIKKENEQHSEMIEPRLVAEDLHDIKKENEQHSEMIEPKKSSFGDRKLWHDNKLASFLKSKPLKRGRFKKNQKNEEFVYGPNILP